MSLAGIEPVGFRVKSDLRHHRVLLSSTAELQIELFRTGSVPQESNAWGLSVFRVICVTIDSEQSYNRGCAIARWLRKSPLGDRDRDSDLGVIAVHSPATGLLAASHISEELPVVLDLGGVSEAWAGPPK